MADRGGSAIDDRGGFEAGARFLVVRCRDLGILAPLARVDAPTAALLWLQHTPSGRDAALANDLLIRLDEANQTLLAIKQGWVAGPPERPGATEVDADLIGGVLDQALGDVDVWEEDPDFGYSVPARALERDARHARALLPRLLYADHDRAYEHAGLVVAAKRERAEIARALPGLDERVSAAAGWPPAPTGREWRD